MSLVIFSGKEQKRGLSYFLFFYFLTKEKQDMSNNKRIVCADGFNMSVQASETNYCSPRVDHAERYTAVEVGFPSQMEPLLMEWAENENMPTETVYGWVPSERVALVCAKHGGVVEGELPAGVVRLNS